MNLSFPPPGAEAVLLALVLGAAVYDVMYRRIPNWLNALGALAGIALNTFLYQGLAGTFFALKGLGLAFAIYFGLRSEPAHSELAQRARRTGRHRAEHLSISGIGWHVFRAEGSGTRLRDLLRI